MIWVDEQGFSLIEMIVSIVLIALLGGAAYGVFAYGSSYYLVGDAITDLQRSAYGAMDDMGRILKEGQKNGISIPSTLHPTGNTDDCIDITNQDGGTTSYFYSNGNLLRNNNDGSDDITLIDATEGIYVANIQFTDNDPVVTIRLRVRLSDTTISESGHGNIVNIVLVEGDTGECGEDCIELYSDIIPRCRILDCS